LWYVEEYYNKILLKRHKLERGISVLGRNNNESKRVCDIEPRDKSKISQKHAAVYFVEGEPWLVDVGSTHGTKLLANGYELPKVAPLTPRRLLDCHRFRVADTSFRVVRIGFDLNEKGVVEQAKKAKKAKKAKEEEEEEEEDKE
jgi:pSer/pThr/pTyr-binding forkhead associated (FHA) protein